jgi:O-antigen ligase
MFMKNTMQTDINKSEVCYRSQSTGERPATVIETGERTRWLGVPFLLAAFFQGLPIAGGLQVQGARFAEDIFKSTQARATTLGYEDTIVLVLFWGALYLYAAAMTWRVLRPSTLLRFWPFSLIIVVMMGGLFWTPYPGKVAVNIVHNVGVFAIAYAAAYCYRQDSRVLLAHLGIVLGLNLVVHGIAIVTIPAIAVHLDGRWCGLTSNANTLGSIGFIALWANGAAVGFTSKAKRTAHIAFCLLAVVILAGTQSLTSIICALAAVGGIYLFESHSQHRSIRTGWVSLVFFGGFLITLLVFNFETSDLFAVLGRTTDFSGRVTTWQFAVDLILQAPVFGYGFDDNAYANQISGLPFTTYHNGFLDLAVRGGLLSLFFLLLLFIRWYHSFKKSSDLPTFFGTFFLPFLLSSILYNMTEVSFFAARNLLWITFLVAYITPAISISQPFQGYQRKDRN